MKQDELLAELFGAGMSPLAGSCAGWMAASPRFAAFLEVNRGKIRKKVRLASAGEVGRIGDLRAELEVAALLLRHPPLALEYEVYAAGKTRGPDFTATLKGHTRCNVEVKRLRAGNGALEGRVAGAVCEKLRQMPPSIPNLLWMSLEDAAGVTLDLPAVMKTLLQRVEARDDALLARHGFADRADFFAGWLRLSGVLVRADTAAALWPNPQARHPLPRDLATLLSC